MITQTTKKFGVLRGGRGLTSTCQLFRRTPIRSASQARVKARALMKKNTLSGHVRGVPEAQDRPPAKEGRVEAQEAHEALTNPRSKTAQNPNPLTRQNTQFCSTNRPRIFLKA